MLRKFTVYVDADRLANVSVIGREIGNVLSVALAQAEETNGIRASCQQVRYTNWICWTVEKEV